MTDFAAARENMVESQVRPNGVTDRRIIDAMAAVAREDFVPASRRNVAYVDDDLDLGGGRYLMEAMVFAKLVHLAEIKPEDKVLLVGDGMGYGAAVVSQFAAHVVALEQAPELVSAARGALSGHQNVTVAEGRLAEGHKAGAPYNVIVIEGRVEEVPDALLAQLAANGRLVAVIGERDVSKAQVVTVANRQASAKPAFDASVAALPGFARKRPAFVF